MGVKIGKFSLEAETIPSAPGHTLLPFPCKSVETLVVTVHTTELAL